MDKNGRSNTKKAYATKPKTKGALIQSIRHPNYPKITLRYGTAFRNNLASLSRPTGAEIRKIRDKSRSSFINDLTVQNRKQKRQLT